MERECGVDDVGAHLAHQERELVSRGVQVVGQDGAVDGEQGLGAREADSEGREVSLQNRMTGYFAFLQHMKSKSVFVKIKVMFYAKSKMGAKL